MSDIKKRITDYWTQRAESFSQQRRRELEDDIHQRWLDELKKYIPMDKPLRILDLGTGTGFFAFLLTAEGHSVTGIDLTENMIEQAGKTAAELKLPAEFYVMDAECPDFAPGSFDVLVSRNLTWVLPNLSRAYKAWHTLLKPGGILLNFDADYCHEDKNRAVPDNHAHKLIDPRLIKENEQIKKILREEQKLRPQWDVELLKEAGFCDISVDSSVWKRIYRDFDEFYNPTPIFTIVAYAGGTEA